MNPMNSELPPPAAGRTRVTAQRSRATTIGEFPVARELEEQSGVGRALVDSLIHSQLRLAVVVGCGFLLLLCAIPILLASYPALNSITLWGVPLPWIVLGAGIYPVICLSAWLYARSADRNEDSFRDLVSHQ